MNTKVLALSLIASITTGINAASTAVVTTPKPLFTMANAFVINRECINSNRALSQAKVIHHEGKFFVDNEGVFRPVQGYNVSREIQGLSQEDIIKFLQQDGYLTLSQKSDGEYGIDMGMRLRGGLLAGAFLAYWGVKAVGYTTYIVGVGLIGAGLASTGIGGLAAGAGGATHLAGITGFTVAYLAKVEAVANAAFFIGAANPLG